jgi:hypothetical protein
LNRGTEDLRPCAAPKVEIQHKLLEVRKIGASQQRIDLVPRGAHGILAHDLYMQAEADGYTLYVLRRQLLDEWQDVRAFCCTL